MNIIIDTSAYSALQRGNQPIKSIFNTAQQIYIPTIVIGELKAGFAFGAKKEQNERLLNRFVADSAVSVVNINDRSPDIFARLYAQLRKSGHAVSQNDLWIASLAVEHQLPLLTLDSDFSYIEGLELVSIQ